MCIRDRKRYVLRGLEIAVRGDVPVFTKVYGEAQAYDAKEMREWSKKNEMRECEIVILIPFLC